MSQRRTILCVAVGLCAVIAIGLVIRSWRSDGNGDRTEPEVEVTVDEAKTILDGFSEEDRAKIEAAFAKVYETYGRNCVTVPCIWFRNEGSTKILEDIQIIAYPLNGQALNSRLN